VLPPAADVVDDNIGAYCTLDASGKRPTKELTTAEKEQIFLEAMSVGAAAAAAAGLQLVSQQAAGSGSSASVHAHKGIARSAGCPAHATAAAALAACCAVRTAHAAVEMVCPPTGACCCCVSRPTHLQSYYFEGKAALSNEEFDNLKQELQWEGSKVVVLRWVGTGMGRGGDGARRVGRGVDMWAEAAHLFHLPLVRSDKWIRA